MRKLFKEFRDFIKRGSVFDLAVGIVIGGAFQKIVSSLVNDIIMPLISIIGGINIAEAKWVFKSAVLDANGAVTQAEIALMYGAFIQTVIDFLIIAFAIFIAIKVVAKISNKLEKVKHSIENIIIKEKAAEEVAEKTQEDTEKAQENTEQTNTVKEE